jgi:hypothetical protein
VSATCLLLQCKALDLLSNLEQIPTLLLPFPLCFHCACLCRIRGRVSHLLRASKEHWGFVATLERRENF